MIRDTIVKKWIILLLCGVWISCGQGDNSQTEEKAKDTTDEVVENQVEDELDEDDEELSFLLPSPLQIASIFKKSGLSYSSGITNPIENITKYTSNLSKSLNFGVYSADLSYAVLNNQAQEARNYMKAVKQMSDELGMGTIFSSESLFESFERNIGNEDSMIYILASIQEEMDMYLEESNQEYLSPVYFAGAWIEGMYIGSKVAKTKDNKKLAARLVEQMTILENLIKGLEMYPKKSDELDQVIADLKEIQSLYKNMEAVKKFESGEYDLDTIQVDDKELDKLSAKIEEVRNKITKA